MPRPTRPVLLDAIFHVMARGNDGQPILLDDDDACRFQSLLLTAKKRLGLKIYSHCLMPNHFHLLLHVLNIPLSHAMQWILTCYASYFNKRWKRKGHLFQARFKSIHCADDRYFLGLLRYINLNPVRSKLTQTPGSWPWSSHGELSGTNAPRIVDESYPLSMFHEDIGIARERYTGFILAGIIDCDKTPDPFSLTHAEAQVPLQSPPKEASSPESEMSLQEIAKDSVGEFGVSLEALQNGSRARDISRARHILIRRAIAGGYRPFEIAALLHCSMALISKALRTHCQPNT